jgi:hypothetical protein
MTSAPVLLDHIDRAEHHVRNARQSWNASSSDCAECLEHLERAIAAMRQAQRAAADPSPAPQAKGRLQQLYRDVTQFGRLIDASSSFYRGLALHSGMDEAASSPAEG